MGVAWIDSATIMAQLDRPVAAATGLISPAPRTTAGMRAAEPVFPVPPGLSGGGGDGDDRADQGVQVEQVGA